jgi:hypothetical protein
MTKHVRAANKHNKGSEAIDENEAIKAMFGRDR